MLEQQALLVTEPVYFTQHDFSLSLLLLLLLLLVCVCERERCVSGMLWHVYEDQRTTDQSASTFSGFQGLSSGHEFAWQVPHPLSHLTSPLNLVLVLR